MYNDTHQELIENYCLTTEQLHYICEPVQAVALAKQDPNRYAVLALENEKLVAFLILHVQKGPCSHSNKNNSIIVYNFSTDFRHFGKRYPQQVLLALNEFIHTEFPDTDELFFSVNKKFINTFSPFAKIGFEDTKVQYTGVNGTCAILKLTLYQSITASIL